MMMRRLACCRRRTKDFSIDLDEHDSNIAGVMTYSGLESCILNSCSYDNESGGSGMSRSDGCAVTDSLDEDCASCSSSKETLSSSFSSLCLVSRKHEEDHLLDELETIQNRSKGKVPITYSMHHLDVQTMKDRFAKLLLGEDTSGGTKGISAALALSNAITSLSVSVFGELWKLEPLPDERKNRWRREMDWLLSPTNYMVELVPAKQLGSSGGMLEIMTPKTRSDIHVNLPALQKLDSILIDVLDSMVETEFWYVEGGSRGDDRSSSGNRTSKRWWLPSPRVPDYGLSPTLRKRLSIRAKLVNQVLKAAKSINEQVLLQMPIPQAITDALPKSGRASLGEEIYRCITAVPYSIEETLLSMNLKSEHAVLEALNRLEGALFSWKQRISDEEIKRSPIRYPWYFARDGGSVAGRIQAWMERADMLVRLLKNRFPNLPQTFIEVTKIQYNKDVGHSILEAYSKVIVNLAFSILSRIGDILQEDDLKKPPTPISTLKFDFFSDAYLAGFKETPPGRNFESTKVGKKAEL
ncbi:rop guanine nucleotide exchange factor 14 isoform X1 [Dendrobium catenatum]|uniref:rop guanine nucleotide exchange factor 14 isoform X1 n=1 Tax=Dendrobium catenatum TaxID=906689 RepID=UPI0009F57EC8|nr:rop guanine nucleotide exchange factor 14 isoform X1 [Dendrobium catenatum]XP_020694627.1 rop guanine nucleotide exchange factor 14 isoform X1 [Dendrobium catenatum]XP_020694628.1 rop guanine nucleotide exchange factor 14 isoform X1 [Dendrobium catenatum]XP_028556325.1 rop guanine nucleotide exchange factor 14 isoform X1 [Dendrobium catenatum]